MRHATLAVLLAATACGGTDGAPAIDYGDFGPLAGDAGKGSWRFGVATAATQIEDMNPATDWYTWTAPTAQGGLAKSTFVGDATRGYSMDLDDVALVKTMGLDSYRFSIEWARIEPVQDQIDEAAIQHYRDELIALRAAGIHPLVTVHHWANPIWIADPRDPTCADGPTPANLCGYDSELGAAMIVEQAGQHANLLGARFGDLVDDWGTVNEPVNFLVASYGVGSFPPGKALVLTSLPKFIGVVRTYLAMHAAIYHALKTADTVDADGDGVAASVGFSVSVADWEPTRNHKPSTDPEDVAARDRLVYLFHYLFVDTALTGSFDSDLDGTGDEPHPDWANTVDWLGVQYYFRAGVSGDAPLLPSPISLTPCFGGFDNGACLPTKDTSYCVPHMGYEGWVDGIYGVLKGFAARYPALPLVVTEAGIATDVGTRRAENIVRELEAIDRARKEGVDVRGYYHWSLTDNFEWAEGFVPHFGLYSVDYSDYARTPTEGADVLTAIAGARQLTAAQRAQYGGTGPMTPEVGDFLDDPLCPKQ